MFRKKTETKLLKVPILLLFDQQKQAESDLLKTFTYVQRIHEESNTLTCFWCSTSSPIFKTVTYKCSKFQMKMREKNTISSYSGYFDRMNPEDK